MPDYLTQESSQGLLLEDGSGYLILDNFDRGSSGSWSGLSHGRREVSSLARAPQYQRHEADLSPRPASPSLSRMPQVRSR